MSLVYNERSWAIDLISEINSKVKGQNYEIVRASGEAGLKNVKGFLFPDAILYGKNSNVLMGWELKMPDTAIEDLEFFENAQKKAKLLGTNSFLLWNGRSAKLYARDNDEFLELKSWNDARLVDRKTMGLHPEYWISLLGQIIQDIEFYIASGNIPAAKLTRVLNDNFIIEIIESLYSEDAKIVKSEYQKNAIFRNEFDIWSHENGFGKKEERFEELAKLNILSWINRFMFSHYLATKTPKAQLIYDIKAGITLEEALEILEKITIQLNYSQIYKPGLGNSLISAVGWQGRIEVNEFLSSANLLELPDDLFRKVLDNFAESSKRKGMGQYATPKALAKLLVRLTVNDATANFFDPCVGSGTFLKEGYEYKKELGIDSASALGTMWASDKYQLPLQITTLNLLDEGAKNSPLQIFKADVFDLMKGQKVELVDPSDFTKSLKLTLPQMNSIVSNLPFIRFESSQNRGPTEVADDLFERTNLDEAKKLGKADIYATIIFQLWEHLEPEGKLGVVVSNSWMGTDWGKSFYILLESYFSVEIVIRSGNRRWFNNADIITTLLILKKKKNLDKPVAGTVKFVSTLATIDNWDDAKIESLVQDISIGKSTSDVRVNIANRASQSDQEKAGYSIRSNFYDCNWIPSFIQSSIPISDLFEVARGARRGWNPLFYPGNSSKIESEFLIPALKTTSKQTYLTAQPDSVAFCCEETLDNLKSSQKTGALNWVKSFESQVNGKGDPLPEVLAQPDIFWYQMNSKEKANFVISMNPYENLSFLHLEPAAFVDQRLIRINPLLGVNVDFDLMHALLNCSLSLLGVELLGFERGLGVLDISATSLRKNFRVLQPGFLTHLQVKQIKKDFQSLKNRPMKSTIDELASSDRQQFDQTILSAFGMQSYQKDIYETLNLAINERVNF